MAFAAIALLAADSLIVHTAHVHLWEEPLGSHRTGDRVRFVKQVQRSTGAAWPGDTGRVYEVGGDGYRIRKADGVYLDVVKDNEIEPA